MCHICIALSTSLSSISSIYICIHTIMLYNVHNTTGADPTESIETLARRKKLPPPAVISLGEGQEPVAMRAMNAAAINGTWVLLQVRCILVYVQYLRCTICGNTVCHCCPQKADFV
jgi:Dynein heavy chain region D6 P-loop domain